LTPAHLLAVGYLAVVVTAVAFVLWYGAVAALGPGRAGLLTGVVPVAAAGLGAVLGGPVPGPLVWAGIGLVAVGLALGVSADGARRSGGDVREAAQERVLSGRSGDRGRGATA
jgi:drug/metabolite transporter (DMT)-like permease